MTMGGYKGGAPASPVADSKIAHIEAGRRKHERRKRISLRAASQEDVTLIPASEFVIPAQDAQGHSARLGCRLPPAYQRLIHIHVKSQKFPWETESDFLRYAVWKTLEKVSEWVDDEKVSNVRAQINGMLLVVRDEEENAAFLAVIDRCERAVANLVAGGAQANARRMVKELLAQIENMDDAHWRTRYKDEMDRRFGPLLATAPTAGTNRKSSAPPPAEDDE